MTATSYVKIFNLHFQKFGKKISVKHKTNCKISDDLSHDLIYLSFDKVLKWPKHFNHLS